MSFRLRDRLAEKAIRNRILFARRTRRAVIFVASVIAVVFTGYLLAGFTLAPVITETTTSVLWRGALIVYLWAWRIGCVFDTDIQELTYLSFPYRWSWKSYGLVGILLLIGSALCATQGNIQYFAIALAAFFVADHCGWLHLMGVIKQDGRTSEQEYIKRKDFFALEELNVVRNQVCGNWKWTRNYAGAFIVVCALLFAFIPSIGEYVGALLQRLNPTIGVQHAETLVFSILVVLFVVVMEIWHYVMRMRTLACMSLLAALSENYELRKISP